MGKKIALLIGVAEYKNENNLPACQKDVELINQIISTLGKFDDTLLLNNNPTSNQAKEKISSFVKKHNHESIDEAFIYFTGHGTRYEDDFLYLFSDFDKNKIRQTSLSNSEFDAMIKTLNPALTTKVVDACQAGTEYIKSRDDLKEILQKSSTDSFKKIYFFFSSSKEENSIALKDYSVFTKSFALSFNQPDRTFIRYRDIMDFIADDENVKKHQTPMFIVQADNTEMFCDLTDDFIAALPNMLPQSQNIVQVDFACAEVGEISIDEKLVKAFEDKSAEYCDESEANQAMEKLILDIKNHDWSLVLRRLYSFECDFADTPFRLKTMRKIAEWLKNSDEPYFIELEYDGEEYEVQNLLRGLSGRPLTEKRYREWVVNFTVTAPSPDRWFVFTLEPKLQSLPWVKVYVTYVFSKSKITLFAKYETLEDINWNERRLVENNEWKVSTSKLKDVNNSQMQIAASLEEIDAAIVDEISKKLEQ